MVSEPVWTLGLNKTLLPNKSTYKNTIVQHCHFFFKSQNIPKKWLHYLSMLVISWLLDLPQATTPYGVNKHWLLLKAKKWLGISQMKIPLQNNTQMKKHNSSQKPLNHGEKQIVSYKDGLLGHSQKKLLGSSLALTHPMQFGRLSKMRMHKTHKNVSSHCDNKLLISGKRRTHPSPNTFEPSKAFVII